MTLCEFVVSGTPVSAQTNNRKTLQLWKAVVRAEAVRAWAGRPVIQSGDIHLLLVYLWDEKEVVPLDVDNVIKPIQDALEGCVFYGDILVSDVAAHRRRLRAAADLDRVPLVLAAAIQSARGGVYVSVRESRPLEEFL